MTPELLVTLWPSFPHFPRFVADRRLAGIRLNSAMMAVSDLDKELALVAEHGGTVPLWYDVKGRQLRVTEAIESEDHLELRLNHPISVDTPTVVLFKAAADRALLERLEDGGQRLVLKGWPQWKVRPGESLHLRDPSLKVHGDLFTETELAKISKVKAAGFTKWFLSYVESQRDVDAFLELVGKDAEVFLKIENQAGLNYVANDYRPRKGLRLLNARGDLYCELPRPHQILEATKMIVEKDPEACVGSRILLSVIHEPVPSCADWSELAWLRDIGYNSMMLCDELCLKESLLGTAVNAFEAFRNEYR